MGLDIYFFANEKDKTGIPPYPWKTVMSGDDIPVGFFCKVNALFKWVEDHVGAFENCEKVPITLAHLRALQRDLQALTPENCRLLFPTTEGFFFGSTDYDEGYWIDVEETKRWLETMIDTFDFDRKLLLFMAWW